MISKLHDDLCDYYESSGLTPSEEWPPDQPTSIVSVALIHYSSRRTQKELIEISKRFREGTSAVDKLASSDSRVMKDMKKIFSADPTDQMVSGTYNKLPKRILIEGAPGIGKTVLAKEILSHWAKGNLLHHCTLVFLVYLRDPRLHKIKSINEIIKLYCSERGATHITNYLYEYYGDNVAFVFDGFDEFPVSLQKNSFITNIIKGSMQELYKSTVVVTSRPTATLFLHHVADRRIEILGFAREEREKYISLSLNPNERQELNGYLKQHAILNSLCFIPLHLAILLFLFQQDSLPETLTEMNESFVLHTIYRHLCKSNQPDRLETLTDLPKKIYQFVQKLSKLAFIGLQNNRLLFSLNEIKVVCPEIDDTPNGYGLLQAVQHYVQKGAGSTRSYSFLHFTMQEYFAALHVPTLPNDHQLLLLKTTFWNVNFMFMWMMFVGINGTESAAFDSFVRNNIFTGSVMTSKNTADILSPNDKMKYLYLFQCYVEAKSKIIPEQISAIFSGGNIKFANITLLPHQISSLISFLSTSTTQQWRILDLGKCNLRDIGMDSLLEHVIKSEDNMSTLKYVDLSENKSSPWGVYSAIIRSCCVSTLTLCGDEGMEEYVDEIIDSLNDNKILKSLILCSIGRSGLKPVKGVLLSISGTTLNEVNLSWKKIKVNNSGVFKLPCMQLLLGSETTVNNKESSLSINVLYNSSHKCSSTEVNLSSENISDEEALLLAFGLCNNLTVQRLNISSSKISNDGIINICGCFMDRSALKDLNLSKISFSNSVVDKIAEVVHINTTLLKLNISKCGISNYELSTITGCLKANKILQELNISHNHITTEGADIIADIIQHNLALQKLDISFCNIHSIGALKISKSYESNQTLQELIISWRNDDVTVNTADPVYNLSCKRIGNTGAQIVSFFLQNVMTKVYKLDVSFNDITDDGIVAICGCLKNNNFLKDLDISDNQITTEGACAIAQVIQSNTTLQRLDISGCNIPNMGIVAISDCLEYNKTLKELYSKHNNVSTEGANKIARLIQINTTLKMIDISYCGIPSEGAMKITESCKHNRTLIGLTISWKDIEHIRGRVQGHVVNTLESDCELSGLNIGNSGAEIISNLLCNKMKADKLDISNNSISDILPICNSLVNASSTLQELNLSHNKISIKGAAKIAEVIAVNAILIKLDISSCNICGDKIGVIGDCLKINATLQELNMSHNCISDQGIKKIAEVICINATLQKVDISNCGIPDDGAVVISESYKNNETLQELIISWKNDEVAFNTAKPSLDLSSKEIGNTGALIVSNLLYNNQKIQNINLSKNNLNDSGALAICKCLRSNITLKKLNLSYNTITKNGIEVLFNALWFNRTLRKLNLTSNYICDDGAVIIGAYLKEQSTLKKLYISCFSHNGRRTVWKAQMDDYKCTVHYT